MLGHIACLQQHLQSSMRGIQSFALRSMFTPEQPNTVAWKAPMTSTLARNITWRNNSHKHSSSRLEIAKLYTCRPSATHPRHTCHPFTTHYFSRRMRQNAPCSYQTSQLVQSLTIVAAGVAGEFPEGLSNLVDVHHALSLLNVCTQICCNCMLQN